jgi:arginine exporter protein ArgO
VFQNPRAWQILDVVIALVMWSIAYGLLFRM